MTAVVDARTLRSLREARGWDQQTLARRAGISPPVVSRLERGLQEDVDASVLVALARSLDAPVDTLLAPELRHSHYELGAELTALLPRLSRLSEAQQRQVSAIVQGYLSELPA